MLGVSDCSQLRGGGTLCLITTYTHPCPPPPSHQTGEWMGEQVRTRVSLLGDKPEGEMGQHWACTYIGAPCMRPGLRSEVGRATDRHQAPASVTLTYCHITSVWQQQETTTMRQVEAFHETGGMSTHPTRQVVPPE